MISEICSRVIPFDKLPSKIRVAHYWDGARHISELAREERKENPLLFSEASDAARRLASVSGAPGAPYEILREAFAETRANPGPQEISGYLARFHIDDPLPTLAAAMKTTQNMLTNRLRSFMEIRHECAHTGSTTFPIATSDIRSYCELLEEIGKGIVSLFQTALAASPYVP